LPLKLLEYFSLGLPVVSVRNAAISHYCSEEDCVFFDWDNPASLAQALDRLAANPNLLLHFRQRSIALRERLSWEGEKRKYISLLHELTGIPEERAARAAAI
jgi:glycosyltransferase involved in cell wall biosynthesis